MTVPDTMRAAVIRATGGPEQIEIEHIPVPRPGPGDVLIRLEASAVNHVDLFVRSGAYRTPIPFPFVIGRDAVGTVAATGSDVTAFAPGDRVWCNSMGYAGRQGTFSEYVSAPGERVYPLRGTVTAADAAPVLHAGATAAIGLFREAALAAGETVYVAGAGGAVGGAVVQLAVAAGARVVATASERDVEWCTGLGADVVVPYDADDLPRRLAAAAPQGYDVWWDNSGRHDFDLALPLLRLGGRVVVVAGLRATPTIPVGQLYVRDASLRGFAISNASVADLADAAARVDAALASGSLRSRVGATYSLADAATAHAAMEQGSVRGRVLVHP
ncbi:MULTISPECIES: zinc-binding dehydrogenase [Pseudonocardia]|uniref:Alcohol dehydrogenase n=2 Tax=Pseudonocardia TaxID=1847 RepID=A0A1Y2N5N8_PSEAH|nr:MULTISPECIES: zinc-binding dehydrogenase [Pseudonocardia]OSY42790.1 Alcohol dehydrogenase [Pseudonocardia autotrophica]TDN77367.1 2-desacetyl-2-hydroxyethyl bacteriochlorophyllide A dehydrogenase [Pseudonocardia autotrophica]BBG01391.1 oxidoreductase [Pseudonocardia autotrophica]GEC24447.1 oxidoreductase [Pseudonocardia saturnea]